MKTLSRNEMKLFTGGNYAMGCEVKCSDYGQPSNWPSDVPYHSSGSVMAPVPDCSTETTTAACFGMVAESCFCVGRSGGEE